MRQRRGDKRLAEKEEMRLSRNEQGPALLFSAVFGATLSMI